MKYNENNQTKWVIRKHSLMRVLFILESIQQCCRVMVDGVMKWKSKLLSHSSVNTTDFIVIGYSLEIQGEWFNWGKVEDIEEINKE